ncbi:hypothetical protein HPB48_009933 [Haemaphysalis longicornis]|uniref:Transposable element P transposase-like RNase H domain-containing protein n=1 Tax=Haemaphysalis longicornis TaxID=44386 RepID=A0A9J6GUA5_HAELO|nr:hypothetical protein HPB48_009933 [Haemaphysalis longicornis]
MSYSSQATSHAGAEVPPENSAGQVVCLVSHGQSNKIIKVRGSKKLEDVRKSFGKSEFGQLCDASFIHQSQSTPPQDTQTATGHHAAQGRSAQHRVQCHRQSFATKTAHMIGDRQAAPEDDEVPLATEALVFEVIGLAAPWKMHFGYFPNAGLSGEVLKNLLLEAIRCIQECGLTVVAVVCDCVGANVAMAKLLGCRVHVATFEELEPFS